MVARGMSGGWEPGSASSRVVAGGGGGPGSSFGIGLGCDGLGGFVERWSSRGEAMTTLVRGTGGGSAADGMSAAAAFLGLVSGFVGPLALLLWPTVLDLSAAGAVGGIPSLLAGSAVYRSGGATFSGRGFLEPTGFGDGVKAPVLVSGVIDFGSGLETVGEVRTISLGLEGRDVHAQQRRRRERGDAGGLEKGAEVREGDV